jgi:LysR family transcriptional regulator, flagellar master operon regulator
MDIDLARTFLAVVEAGSFVEAADRVHVTQSTVSMRIRNLEEQLGKVLFERSKTGATLTAAGTQFHRHALTLVRIWEQARLEVSLPPGYEAALTIAAQFSLWDEFLLLWLSNMRRNAPQIAVRAQFGFSSALMQRLIDGSLDIGVMYRPESRPGYSVEMLFEEELVLVSSEPENPAKSDREYIYVDWGPEFRADHTLNFPELSTPGVYMELGSLGLRYLLVNHCAGYFPRRLVQSYLDAGQLALVPQAPTFSYPAYAVYPANGDSGLLDLALGELRRAAAQQRTVPSPAPEAG